MRYLWENAILRTLLIVALLIWLTLSALLYTHPIVVQIYIAAERELERRGLTRVREFGVERRRNDGDRQGVRLRDRRRTVDH